MATRTSVGSGLWSAVGTWDTGVPLNNDVVVIASGHVVTFDVDQSGFADGIDGLTIDGTLYVTRTAGVYYLKIKAAKTITAATSGVFDCGTVGDQMPFNVKFSLFILTGGSVSNKITFYVYGQNPTYKQARLTAGVVAGATVLPIDTDLTGDIWAAGDTIGIDTASVLGASRCEDKLIAAGGITSNSITLTAGLSYKKDAGDYVTLMTRHLFMSCAPNGWAFSGPTSVIHGAWFTVIAGGYLVNSSAFITGDCVYSGGSYGFFIATWARITTGIWRNIGNLFHICTGASLEGGYVGNCNPVFNGGAGHSMSGGVIYGCVNVFSSCSSVFVTGGYVYGAWKCFNTSNIIGSGFTFGVSSYQLLTSVFTFYGVVLAGFSNANYAQLHKIFYSQYFDYQGTTGAYKAWNAGGVTTKQDTTKPVGSAYSMQTVLESATKEGFYQREITVGAGASVNITSWLRKSASMTYLPRAIIFNKATTDPFAGGVGLHTFTMTNSVDTWESDVYTYTNSTTEDITLVIRCQGMNTTGNLFSLVDVEQINVDLTSAIALINSVKARTDLIPAIPAPANEYDVRMAAIQDDLDNPNQYKADVSGLALANEYDADVTTIVELLYSIMGGEGWTNESLVSLMAAIVSGSINETAIRAALGLNSANLDTQLSNIQTDLDDPDQYKADLSGIDLSAIETALNEIKGSGWTDETLAALAALIKMVKSKTDMMNFSSITPVVTGAVGGSIYLHRGDTFDTADITGLGDLSDYVSIDIVVKRSNKLSDDKAILHFRKNANGQADGLMRVNAEPYATRTDGYIDILDIATGHIKPILKAEVTDDLIPNEYVFDVQVIRVNRVKTEASGPWIITGDIARMIT